MSQQGAFAKLATTASAEDILESWLEGLAAAVVGRNAAAFAELFVAEGYWRDILAFSWERPTFSGRDQIMRAFAATVDTAKASHIRRASRRTAPRFARRSGRDVIEAWFDFDVVVGQGAGFVRLVYSPTAPHYAQAWLLLTTLESLTGFEEKVDRNRPSGKHYSQITNPLSWKQERQAEMSFADRDPEVIVVGAGQGGLILAARLRQIGVQTLVIERAARVGDNWRKRYNNLTLHNKLGANHFPYMPFPATWPTWLPKDMLGDWLESYARFMELNVWTETDLEEARYDVQTKRWLTRLRRADGSVREMTAPHLVIATGVSGGLAKRPKFPGLEDFEGAVVHSGEFNSGLDWKGADAIVVGTGNSGHDIAQDLYVSGAKSVSIMQRGATCVLSLEPSAIISYSIYSDDTPVEDTDLMVAALPHEMLLDSYKWITRKTDQLDQDLLAKLNAIGFRTHVGEDRTGFQLLYLRGAGGYYIDVGCSELLIENKIGLLHAEQMDRFEAKGLRMADGRLVPCKLLVLATGFESLQESVRRLLGDEVADRVGPVWGFDENNNIRNMWTRTRQDGLWLMGGAILEARLNSRFLALEIKASLLGLTPDRDALPLRKLA